MSDRDQIFPSSPGRHVESRLRDAFAARADAVTAESLHPSAPPAAARRVPRWVVPTLGGLAVAAASAGIYAGVTPANRATATPPAAPPSATRTAPSVAVVPPPSRTASPSPTPTPSPIPTGILSQTPVFAAAGWVAPSPAGWQEGKVGTDPDADIECIGPKDTSSCHLWLMAGHDPAAPPQPHKLGGGLLPELARLSCRVSDASEARLTTGENVGVIPFSCGDRRFHQVWLAARNQLVVGELGLGQGVESVLQSLGADKGYGPMVTKPCADVVLRPRSDGVASQILVTGAGCDEAQALVVAVRLSLNVVTGAPTASTGSFRCTVTRHPTATPRSADLTCLRADGRVRVTYSQSTYGAA